MKPMKAFLPFAVGLGLLVAGCASTHETDHHIAPSRVATPGAGLLIISATYGSGTHFADVTERVDELLHQPDVEFFARPEWLQADPTPGWNKALTIVYEFKGRRHVFTAGEGGKVNVEWLTRQTDE
jgi:hypothetical protein